ncbi:MAG TPA: branched-chain amino acid ABC transporter permease [Gaiellaceae bacterium]|nr:branched-chain amino acid ABC transporter permease [Gaiellaceae bacterium]
MSQFWQQVISGLASGGIYGSLALALVLIYRATRVINFAQGEMATFAAYVAWTLIDHGVPYWGAFFATLAIAFAGGVAIERTLIRPVESAPPLTVVILTIGLLVGINGATSWIWGGAARRFPSPFRQEPFHVGGVAISPQDLGVIAVSLASVLALWLFFRYARLGLAMRAAAVNPAESRYVGIRVGWMLALGWGIASALGAVAGMMVAPSLFLDPNMMQSVLLYAFAAAVLGGIDSPIGAVVGGLVLGVLLNLVGTYVTSVGGELRLAVALSVILLVLLMRPAGLFGRTAVRRV